jgi:putative redox protein
MADASRAADLTVRLEWQGEGQQFRGGAAGGPEVVIDGVGAAGPSPVVSLGLGLGGCMGADVLDIAQKMRLPVTSLEVLVEADRRAEPPRRLTAVRLRFVVGGVSASDEEKLWRAIELSRERYCSVWHSLRDDIDLGLELELR